MQIFLSTPKKFEIAEFAPLLATALATKLVSALLVRPGELDENAYINRVQGLKDLTQSQNCALLLENRPDLVKQLGADGVHISGDQHDLAKAVNLLQPDFIVGTGNIASRHEAMLRGEAGADYLMFGDLDAKPDESQIELAHWWAELFQTPGLLFNPFSPPEISRFGETDFIGLGHNIWIAPEGPGAAIKTAIAEQELV